MNPSRDKTTLISESPEVYRHTAVRLNHYIIIIGGFHRKSADSNKNHEIWKYNLYTEQWRKYLIPKTKKTRCLHCRYTTECAVSIKESVYMYQIYSSSKLTKQDIWKLTQTTDGCYVWEKVLAKNGTKIPSLSNQFSSWEYSKEMWILAGFGPQLDGYLNDHGEHSGRNTERGTKRTNQLLKFNPVSKEWSNPRSSGTVPNYHMRHTTIANGHKAWYIPESRDYRSTAVFDELYELDMQSLIWTRIQVDQPHPQNRSLHSLNALTESQLVMHGGYGIEGTLSYTWVLHLPSRSWKRYTSYKAHPRQGHTGSLGLNSDIIIIGGRPERFGGTAIHKDIFHVLFEPKCLQQLAMQTVFNHRAELALMSLPRKLRKRMDIEIGNSTANVQMKPRRVLRSNQETRII